MPDEAGQFDTELLFDLTLDPEAAQRFKQLVERFEDRLRQAAVARATACGSRVVYLPHLESVSLEPGISVSPKGSDSAARRRRVHRRRRESAGYAVFGAVISALASLLVSVQLDGRSKAGVALGILVAVVAIWIAVGSREDDVAVNDLA